MLAIPYYLTVAYAFIGNRRKYFWLFCAFLMSIMMLTASSYADFNNYNTYYNSVNTGYNILGFEGIPKAWGYLCRFFGFFHFSYRGMQVIIIFFCLYLIHKIVSSIGLRETVFWGLYLLFPLPIQCVQTRFFLATVLVWYGYSLLVQGKKKALLKFFILYILAFLIHRSSALFIVLLFAYFLKKNTIKRTIILSCIFTILIYALIAYIPSIASYFLVDSTYVRYFTNSTTPSTIGGFFYAFLIWLTSIILAIFTNYLYSNKVLRSKRGIDVVTNIVQNSKYIAAIIFTGLIFPLMKFDNNFNRYMMVSTTFSYFSIAGAYGKMKKNNRRILLVAYLMLISYSIYFYIPFDGILRNFFMIDGFYSIFM